MGKKRLRDNDERFRIGKKGSLEDNIQQLESELGVLTKGAPKLGGESEDEAEKEAKNNRVKPSEEGMSAGQKDTVPKPAAPSYDYYSSHKEYRGGKSLFKNEKFYITLFTLIALAMVLTMAPIFNYTTAFRPDEDFPQVEVSFKYYNNIFGQQKKQATLIRMGERTVLVPIPMVQWMNLDAEKKQLVLNEYLPL